MAYDNLHAINNGVSWGIIANASGYNADHIRQEVAAYQRGDKDKLPKKLATALQSALKTIHNETRLHTYNSELFEGVFELRQREDLARAVFNTVDTSAITIEEVLELWNTALSIIIGPFISGTIDLAIYLNGQDRETLNDKERTTIYISAGALHSITVLWEDAAKVMQKAQPETFEDNSLDFLNINLDVLSIVDLVEITLSLYQLVEAELLSLLRNQRALIAQIKTSLVEIKLEEQTGATETEKPELEERLRVAQREFDLIEQDRAIINMNIASISSHAKDWSDPSNGYLSLMGVPKYEAHNRLLDISGLCRMTMRQAIPLMKWHKRNLLIARNLAYMALQHDIPDILSVAAEHLAEQLNIDQSMLWSVRIVNREPLVSEKDIIDKFQYGQPTILKMKEAV